MFGSSFSAVVGRSGHVLVTLFVFVYVWWIPTYIVFVFCFAFLRRVYPMLTVFLDCLFLIAPSVFSNISLMRSVLLISVYSCLVLLICLFVMFFSAHVFVIL